MLPYISKSFLRQQALIRSSSISPLLYLSKYSYTRNFHNTNIAFKIKPFLLADIGEGMFLLLFFEIFD